MAGDLEHTGYRPSLGTWGSISHIIDIVVVDGVSQIAVLDPFLPPYHFFGETWETVWSYFRDFGEFGDFESVCGWI
jgi:hypothetical protein